VTVVIFRPNRENFLIVACAPERTEIAPQSRNCAYPSPLGPFLLPEGWRSSWEPTHVQSVDRRGNGCPGVADQGVETIFGYPGGAVLPIYDALFHQRHIKHVLCARQGGACRRRLRAVERQGRLLLVTSGPGATNAITGLTDALMDSIPLVCITGQVPTHLIGSDAFQECDNVAITRQLHQA